MNGNKKIVSSSQSIYPWLTRDMVNGCVRRLRKKSLRDSIKIEDSIKKDNSINTKVLFKSSDYVVPTIANKGGCPKGITNCTKLQLKRKYEEVKEKITILYSAKKKPFKKGNSRSSMTIYYSNMNYIKPYIRLTSTLSSRGHSEKNRS